MRSFSLIREAQAQTTITGARREILETIKTHIHPDATLAELNESFSANITEKDYARWLQEIEAHAEEQGAGLGSERNFHDTAFEILDNDPMMDIYGNNEETKNAIVRTLWHMHNATTHHNKAARHLDRSAKKAAREEEELAKKRAGGAEEEWQPSEETTPMQTVIQNGYNAACKDFGTRKETKNPYNKGTKRARAWDEAYTKGMHDKMNPQTSAEDEELDGDVGESTPSAKDLAAADMEGFQAAMAKLEDGDDVDPDSEESPDAGAEDTDLDNPDSDMELGNTLSTLYKDSKSSSEDEELDDLDMKNPEGDDFEEGEPLDGADSEGSTSTPDENDEDQTPEECPHEPGSPLHDAWMAGWERAMSYSDDEQSSDEMDDDLDASPADDMDDDEFDAEDKDVPTDEEPSMTRSMEDEEVSSRVFALASGNWGYVVARGSRCLATGQAGSEGEAQSRAQDYYKPVNVGSFKDHLAAQ